MIEWNAQPVKATMTLYAVIQLSWSSICIRRTSCFCTDCFRDSVVCASLCCLYITLLFVHHSVVCASLCCLCITLLFVHHSGIFNPVMMVGRQFFLPEATIMPTQTYNRVMYKQQSDVQTTGITEIIIK
jgi:hypothetical protein